MKQLAKAWILLMLCAAILAPFFLAHKASEMNFLNALTAPSLKHWMGTDSLGRDLLSRVLWGASVSLGVGFLAVACSVILGVMIGSIAGYGGKWWDRLLMGFSDVMLCFPVFFLILAVIAMLGPGVWKVALIIGATSWMSTARLIRAEIFSLKEREFVLAARGFGAGRFWILQRHLIPNALSPVLVNAVLSFSAAVLMESGLSFLGIGVQPPTPSWGNILMDGKATLGVAWWLLFFPGMMIFLTVLSINTLGENESHRN